MRDHSNFRPFLKSYFFFINWSCEREYIQWKKDFHKRSALMMEPSYFQSDFSTASLNKRYEVYEKFELNQFV